MKTYGKLSDQKALRMGKDIQLTPPKRGPTTLAMPHVAPMSPPYFPRLVKRQYHSSGQVRRDLLLQWHNVADCNVNLRQILA